MPRDDERPQALHVRTTGAVFHEPPPEIPQGAQEEPVRNEKYTAITRRIQAAVEEQETRLTDYCEITVTVQAGRPTLTRITTTHKPGVGSDLAPNRWLDYPPATTSPADLRGRPCFGGLSAAGHGKEAAFVLLFPPDKNDNKWRTLEWTAVAPERGKAVDADVVATAVMDMTGRYMIAAVGFDPWEMPPVAAKLADVGLLMTETRNSYAAAAPAIRLLLELMDIGKIVSVFPHPAGLGRLALKKDANGNLRPDYGKSTGIASPIGALVNAMSRALAHTNKAETTAP